MNIFYRKIPWVVQNGESKTWFAQSKQCEVMRWGTKRQQIHLIPRTTLFRLSTNSNATPAQAVETKLGRSAVLPQELEDQLVEYLLLMEKKFYGLTRSDVKRMAYQLVTLNNLPNPFSKDNESAGRKWLDLFLKRHKDRISVRKPTGTSIHRAKGFNKDTFLTFWRLNLKSTSIQLIEYSTWMRLAYLLFSLKSNRFLRLGARSR